MNNAKHFFVILCVAALLCVGAACQRTRWGNLSLTPTEVLKFQNEAMKDRHVGMIKHTLSSDSILMLEKRADTLGTTLDEYLKMMSDEVKSRTFEFRNERIAGDNTATVEVKNHYYNQWTKAYFVKENGGWKVDLVTELKWKLP